ncbi:hypothetical protein C8F01DRAFT_1248497 [Mycena amicta]|nr:hypothetical protein C8F01DRAFT_1248497 [Mycena amicta]
MLSQIPADIWRCIAEFIPVPVLATLCSVNRVFLDIAREARYRAISFDAYNSAKPLIKHIKDSSLVHSVRIQPWLVCAKECRPPAAWKMLYSCVFSRHQETFETQIARRLHKQTRMLADTIRALPNLHSYHLDWDEGPVQGEFLSALLDVLIPSIGCNLYALNLKVPFQHIQSLPCLARYLPHLQSLSLTIHTGSHNVHDVAQRMEALVFFLNFLLRNLRSLALYTTPTSIYLNLGVLFAHLGHGRRLTSFTLCIPFDGGHLPDPKSLRRFLIQHRETLDSLTLGTTRAAASANATSNYLWIRDSLKNHPPFPALTHLSLALRPLRTDISPLLKSLSGMHLLQRLRLGERPLEFVDLLRLLEVLDQAPALRALSIRLRWLSPETVDALAASLPHLEVLHLHFAEVIHSEPSSSVTSTLSQDSYGSSRVNELALFCQALKDKTYPHWRLARLAMPESPRQPIRWLDTLERVFVECVPGLKSFEELLSPI